MARKTKLGPNQAPPGGSHGKFNFLDDIPQGDPAIAPGISTYISTINGNQQGNRWVRIYPWIENILFSAGRHYIDDILISRLARDSATGDQSIVSDAVRDVPRPVNDFLGRYVETNIALLTENRPRPRVTAKSNKAEDEDAARLSEFTLEYLWEALNMPEQKREIARVLLNCGVAWSEIWYDPMKPRRMTVPKTRTEAFSILPGPGGQVQLPLPRQVPMSKNGQPVYTEDVEFGDITSKVISPFEMYLPNAHTWDGDDMPWIMREWFANKYDFVDKFHMGKMAMNMKKKDGWYLDRLDSLGQENLINLPIWWWERLVNMVEGPGPSMYMGSPETRDDWVVCRWFDRRPCSKFPRGRSILMAGGQVIYDSPKDRGARAYDPRWPDRWHPYTRFRWEPMLGSIYGRALVTKLLPKLKRVNSIDMTMIMYRRVCPIATWIAPKGSHPIEDLWFGQPGGIWEYDAIRTGGKAPEPVFPPEYPRSMVEERTIQIQEMEAIAGTEEILRGQRPEGVNSATMLEVLRKQALASRSSILQSWDESLQNEGSILLQETIKHVNEDPRYAERIRILAREKSSRLAIKKFSGTDLSDNVIVRVDTVSMASVSKEAKEQKALEIMQYSAGLENLPPTLREALMSQLGFEDAMKPQGPDIDRVKRILSYIRSEEYDWIIPMPEDDPYVFWDFFVTEVKSESFRDYNQQQQFVLLGLIDTYKQQIAVREQAQMIRQQQMMMMQGGGQGGGQPPPGGQG
jgi:hypothetical protein